MGILLFTLKHLIQTFSQFMGAATALKLHAMML
jgi:hypothetical protein